LHRSARNPPASKRSVKHREDYRPATIRRRPVICLGGGPIAVADCYLPEQLQTDKAQGQLKDNNGITFPLLFSPVARLEPNSHDGSTK
jgi:hypothetical protein